MRQRTDPHAPRAADRRPPVTRLLPAETDASGPGSGVLAQISNAIVQLHKRHYGKGPTKARTIYAEDLVLTRLENSLTRAEETLVSLGRGEDVRKMRAAFQEALESEFVAVIEQFTGHKVRAYISDIHLATGTAVELFLLERDNLAESNLDGAAKPGA